MAITQGTDTYISLADADTYIAAMAGDYPTVWAAISEDSDKEAYLKRAARILDGKWGSQFVGAIYKNTQTMEFPRDGTDRSGRDIAGEYPTKLQDAQAEIAARLANGEDLTEDRNRGGDVKRKKIGPIETEWNVAAPVGKVFEEIEGLLWLYLRSSNTTKLLRS